MQVILVRIQPGRSALRGVAGGVGIRPLPTQARARLAPCGEPIACEHIDLWAMWAICFRLPTLPTIGGRGRFVGHVGNVVTEIKSERAQQNAPHTLQTVCLYSSLFFLT